MSSQNSNPTTASQRFTTNEYTSIEVYGKNAHLEATLKNLSATGAFLECTNQHAVTILPGDLICMTIHLSQIKKQHRVSAEVVWHNETGTGVTFLLPEELFEKFRERTKTS